MAINKIQIHGLRGFATEQELPLGIPSGVSGSGLTILVGPNNAGKSTIIEAIRSLSRINAPSFSEGKRNRSADYRIRISVVNDSGEVKELRTVASGGSETEWVNPNHPPLSSSVYVLPSRRYFNPFFGKNIMDRQQYIQHTEIPIVRGEALHQFSNRLFQIQTNREGFDAVLAKVLEVVPHWTIDQADSGQHYLKFESTNTHHTSEGLGEGIVSLFFIADALYDSKPGDIIAIDEPELSLHPALQRKLAALLVEYSAERQIVYATHSPFFADFAAIGQGAKVARVFLSKNGCEIAVLGSASADNIRGLLQNLNSPHILGLDAREVFFLDDGVILVEGQEDVVFYKLISQQVSFPLGGSFFGWGVGGAHNLEIIAGILSDLGFRTVVGIVDGDKQDLLPRLQARFSDYKFFAIPAKDIRTKPARPATEGVYGLLDKKQRIRDQYKDEVVKLFQEINRALSTDSV